MGFEGATMSTETVENAGGKVRFGLALALGVGVPGLAKYYLTQMGFGDLGTVVFYTGYFTAAVAIWYIWVRPIDFDGS
jgi:TM2 domain-containing membrane protein YozV